jgi:hypothetical protein
MQPSNPVGAGTTISVPGSMSGLQGGGSPGRSVSGTKAQPPFSSEGCLQGFGIGRVLLHLP